MAFGLKRAALGVAAVKLGVAAAKFGVGVAVGGVVRSAVNQLSQSRWPPAPHGFSGHSGFAPGAAPPPYSPGAAAPSPGIARPPYPGAAPASHGDAPPPYPGAAPPSPRFAVGLPSAALASSGRPGLPQAPADPQAKRQAALINILERAGALSGTGQGQGAQILESLDHGLAVLNEPAADLRARGNALLEVAHMTDDADRGALKSHVDQWFGFQTHEVSSATLRRVAQGLGESLHAAAARQEATANSSTALRQELELTLQSPLSLQAKNQRVDQLWQQMQRFAPWGAQYG